MNHMLFRQLALLLHAGVPLSQGADLLAQDSPDKELLEALSQALDEGQSLSQALGSMGGFPAWVLGMLTIGEETGRMEETLTALADHFDRRERTCRQIRNALTYPAMILGLMMVVIVVLLTEVLPVFDRVYASLGSGLTGFAGALLRFGQGLKSALPALLILLLAGIALGILFAKNSRFREKLTRAFREKFGDKGISRRFYNARFAQGLAMGLASGLALEQALELSGALLSDVPPAAKRCRKCAECLESGGDLAEALAAGELLTPAHTRLLTAGVRGGTGDQVMALIAEKLSQEAEDALENAVARVEPALVLVCSALVGAILLAVMLPLMGVLSALG